jgi:hypothetical protein
VSRSATKDRPLLVKDCISATDEQDQVKLVSLTSGSNEFEEGASAHGRVRRTARELAPGGRLRLGFTDMQG